MGTEHSSLPGTIGLSVVVPCYNEEKVLPELHSRLTTVCRTCLGDDYEIILVSDGSRDQTWPKIKALSVRDPHVVGVNLSRNFGHQLALTAGLSICRGVRILILDADLQDPPELLPDMLALADQGADVVYGQRRTRDGETWFKKTSAALFYRLLRRMADIDIPVDSGDFRLMSRRAMEALQSMPEQYRFIRGMVTWVGYKQVALPYDRAERFADVSKYSFRKMVFFSLDAITGFSTRPLRMAIYAGVALALLSIVMISFTFYSWMVGDVVAGWSSVMTVMLILGSANMLFLGVIGEYLGRLFMEAKRRPLFVIEEIVHLEEHLHEVPSAIARSPMREGS
jgi:dolichol-phosphate mannosyltransferase